jgi:hypothetical protein
MDILHIFAGLAGNRMPFARLKGRAYCVVRGTRAANLNRSRSSRLFGCDHAHTLLPCYVTVYGADVGAF